MTKEIYIIRGRENVATDFINAAITGWHPATSCGFATRIASNPGYPFDRIWKHYHFRDTPFHRFFANIFAD